jgi:hypothetical protein
MGTTVLVCGRGEDFFNALFSGREAARKQIQHWHESCRVADYAVDFSTLAAESAWNQEALFDMFLHGVSEEVKDELADRELPTDLDSLIALTIQNYG